MPTSRESLARHRSAHADADAHERVWFFHAHVYFDHDDPACVSEAQEFREEIDQTFASTDHVEVHSFLPGPLGPHPRGSFEVLFTRDAFTDFVSWLMFSRGDRMDVLVHPLTRSQTLDHGARAMWLGTPRPVDLALLREVDERLVASGRSEIDIIDGTKAH